MYNSPIQYAPLLKDNKFKKFELNVEGTTKINNEEVIIIQFSSQEIILHLQGVFT